MQLGQLSALRKPDFAAISTAGSYLTPTSDPAVRLAPIGASRQKVRYLSIQGAQCTTRARHALHTCLIRRSRFARIPRA